MGTRVEPNSVQVMRDSLISLLSNFFLLLSSWNFYILYQLLLTCAISWSIPKAMIATSLVTADYKSWLWIYVPRIKTYLFKNIYFFQEHTSHGDTNLQKWQLLLQRTFWTWTIDTAMFGKYYNFWLFQVLFLQHLTMIVQIDPT